MALLINKQHPELRIYNPATGKAVRFEGGRLEIDEDDENYEAVMKAAKRRSEIEIHVKTLACPDCDEKFPGDMAKARLARHRNQEHPGSKTAEKPAPTRRVKAAAQHVCELCTPPQTFEDEEKLAEHSAVLHTSKEASEKAAGAAG